MSPPPSFAILPSSLLQTPAPAASGSSHSTQLPAAHRLLRLPNARTGLPALYLIDETQAKVYEVQKIAPEAERSWFLGDEVVQDGRLLLFTPIDPVFLLLPIVIATTANPSRFLLADHLFSTAASLPAFKLPAPFAGPQTDVKGKGRAADGDADEAPADEGEVDDVLFVGALPAVDKWLARVCDVKEVAEGMIAYRYSADKAHAYLRRKVGRLAAKETFARFGGLVKLLARDGLVGLDASEEDGGGASSKEPAARSEKDEKEDQRLEAVREEARQHYALSTLQPYLSPTLLASVTATYAFPLYVAHMASLAPALGSSSSFAAEVEESKLLMKREKENEKKRKAAPVSQGVGKLKKVNTNGMGKLTGFFKPKPKEEAKKK